VSCYTEGNVGTRSAFLDAVGNRTGKTDGSGFGRYETTYSYSPRNELLGEGTYRVEEDEQGEELWVYVGGWTYSYDLRGNMVTKGDPEGYWWWVYTWSADDKLLKREFHDDYGSEERTKVEYKYDLLGRRIAKRVTPAYGAPGPWRWYFYDGLQVTAEGTGTNDKMYYTHSPSAIGGIIARDNNGTKLFYHFDRLGNVMAVTDSNGRAYAVYTMEAFGNVSQVGTSTGYYSQYATDPQPYHLTTKEFDPDAGLYYFNARWYDPATARFLTPDPETHGPTKSGRPREYTYAQENPMGAVDPTGCKCMWVRTKAQVTGVHHKDCGTGVKLSVDAACREACRKQNALYLNFWCYDIYTEWVFTYVYRCPKNVTCPAEGARKKEWKDVYSGSSAGCFCYYTVPDEYFKLLIDLKHLAPG